MIADHLTGMEQFGADYLQAAGNSNLASNEHFMPVLCLIFLRHAPNRYCAAVAAI